MLLFLRDSILKCVFFVGITFFWFLVRIIVWREYCPTFICDPFDGVQDKYDYIVVGAGTAGCVVALRLAEDPNVSVLLVEAGPMGGSLIDIPAALALLQLSPLDWKYKTVPQENAAKGMKDKVVLWPRGKVVGGSGRLNNMMYVRGSPLDYKEWYKAKPYYNYEKDILYYFKKSENHLGIFSNNTKHHGRGGPLYVDDIPFITDLGRAVLESAESLGFPIRDINGEHTTGFSKPQANLRNGTRYSTGHYLLDNKPKNVKLLTNTFAEKILFKDKFEARAVLVAKFGTKTILKARKGIILSAGAVDTPKLLMLSGIGNKEELKKLGIDAKKDLPVGENLHDHVTTGIDLITLGSPLEINQLSLISPFSIYDYISKGVGPYTSIQCEVIICLHTDCMNGSDFQACTAKQTKPPDLQVLVLSLGSTTDNGAHLKNVVGIDDNVWENYMKYLVGTTTISILPVVLKPKSRGFIKLASKDPYTPPLIDPRYLTHKEDVNVLVKGIELVKRIVQSEQMMKIGATLYNKPLPGCEEHVFDSVAYWECYVRHMTLTVYHPVGSVKMGHPMDKTSVVDFDFKVIGVNKLFVADASVMPEIPSGNTNAPTVLVAEMASDSIKLQEFLNTGRCYLHHIFIQQKICDNV